MIGGAIHVAGDSLLTVHGHHSDSAVIRVIITNVVLYLTAYIWSRKGLDVACVRLLTDRVLFHAHTTHSVTEVSLSRGHMSGMASQDTYAMRISPIQQLQAWTENILVFLQPGRNVTFCSIARYKYSYWTEPVWHYTPVWSRSRL